MSKKKVHKGGRGWGTRELAFLIPSGHGCSPSVSPPLWPLQDNGGGRGIWTRPGLPAAPAPGQVRGRKGAGKGRVSQEARQGGVSEPGFQVPVGGLGGDIAIYIIFPTEYVKTQLQLNLGICTYVREPSCSPGVLGPHPGLGLRLYRSTPRRCSGSSAATSRTAHAGCWAAWELAWPEAAVVVCPMETIQVKFIEDQTSPNSKYRGLFHPVGNIVREQDVPGPHGHCAEAGSQPGHSLLRHEVPTQLVRREQAQHDPETLVPAFSELSRHSQGLREHSSARDGARDAGPGGAQTLNTCGWIANPEQ